MKRHMILAVALTALLLSGCTLAGVRGSGDLVTESRQVSDFDRVALSGSGQVVITQGAEEGLSVEADDNLMQYVRTEVSGRTLELGLDAPGTIVRPSRLAACQAGAAASLRNTNSPLLGPPVKRTPAILLPCSGDNQ